MIALVLLVMLGQVVVTSIRPNDAHLPVDLSMTCALLNGTAAGRQLKVSLLGAIGANAGVTAAIDGEQRGQIEVIAHRATAMLNSADDHTQNQLINEIEIRADGRNLLGTLSVTYPTAMKRPAIFNNRVAIGSAELVLTNLKDYRTINVGGEQLHVAKTETPPIYLRGPCVLSPASDGAAQ